VGEVAHRWITQCFQLRFRKFIGNSLEIAGLPSASARGVRVAVNPVSDLALETNWEMP
jgi:hypothetical protein